MHAHACRKSAASLPGRWRAPLTGRFKNPGFSSLQPSTAEELVYQNDVQVRIWRLTQFI
jgi:hypothetical protein